MTQPSRACFASRLTYLRSRFLAAFRPCPVVILTRPNLCSHIARATPKSFVNALQKREGVEKKPCGDWLEGGLLGRNRWRRQQRPKLRRLMASGSRAKSRRRTYGGTRCTLSSGTFLRNPDRVKQHLQGTQRTRRKQCSYPGTSLHLSIRNECTGERHPGRWTFQTEPENRGWTEDEVESSTIIHRAAWRGVIMIPTCRDYLAERSLESVSNTMTGYILIDPILSLSKICASWGSMIPRHARVQRAPPLLLTAGLSTMLNARRRYSCNLGEPLTRSNAIAGTPCRTHPTLTATRPIQTAVKTLQVTVLKASPPETVLGSRTKVASPFPDLLPAGSTAEGPLHAHPDLPHACLMR